MTFKHFLKHEKRLWHKHFVPSIIAGLVVAVITATLKMTAANVVLFASIGASAMILTHTESHHLTKLRSSIVAYTAMIVIAILIREINTLVPLTDSVNVFLSVTIVGIGVIMLDAFHPPAISASLSFALFEMPLMSLFWLFITVILMLVIVRLLTYLFTEKLTFKEFGSEFKKAF